MIEVGRAYDAADIADTPPPEHHRLFESNPFVVCSDLPRSSGSAAVLGVTRVDLIDPLFRECGMPYFSVGGIKLPVKIWVALQRGAWLCGYTGGSESFSQARSRAKQAAGCLINLAEHHHHVLLVGHGMLNHFIAGQLLQLGWQGPRRCGSHYWQYANYRR